MWEVLFVLSKRKKDAVAEEVSYAFLGQSESESSHIQGLEKSKLEIDSISQSAHKLSKTKVFEIVNRWGKLRLWIPKHS